MVTFGQLSTQGSAQKILSGGKSRCEIYMSEGLELLWDMLDSESLARKITRLFGFHS